MFKLLRYLISLPLFVGYYAIYGIDQFVVSPLLKSLYYGFNALDQLTISQNDLNKGATKGSFDILCEFIDLTYFSVGKIFDILEEGFMTSALWISPLDAMPGSFLNHSQSHTSLIKGDSANHSYFNSVPEGIDKTNIYQDYAKDIERNWEESLFAAEAEEGFAGRETGKTGIEF